MGKPLRRVQDSQKTSNQPSLVSHPQEIPKGREDPDLQEEITKLLTEAYQDGTLTSLIAWWRARGGAPLPMMEQRPIFVGERRNTGIHVLEALLDRAAEKAKQDKARTGGSLSKLVELLLWKYLAEPSDVIENSPTPET